MKRIISVLLTVMTVVACGVVVHAASTEYIDTDNKTLNMISVLMDEPVVGGVPPQNPQTTDTANVYVTGVKWEGDFDENGCFRYGGTYTVRVNVSIKEGVDLIIKDWYNHNFTINGKEAIFTYSGDVVTSGVISYVYKNLGMPHQNHCFCGGELTLGEHTSHKEYTYQPWDGVSKISYVNDVAYVYLTSDVTRTETFRVPGGKTINLCLNGHTMRKSGGDRVINISSGGKLRLCDCSYMKTGKVTGGAHQMGGGVHNGGTFVMYGGKIMGNGGTYGGGLWNNYNFYMYGGEISYNAASYGGGIWNANSGEAQLIIYGGSIYKNQANYGGGLWNNDNGNISMKGGEFRENIANNCGGAVWNQGKNFFMEDGFIIKNFANKGAGVWTQSVFTMSGGFITYNEALDSDNRDNDNAVAYGGGVWVNEKSIFQMKGGQISLNSAALAGGGVWLNNTGEFIMQGGSIAANTAKIGGGVYIQRYEGAPGIFRLSGDSEVVNNTGILAGGGMYIKGVLEVTGGIVESNYSDSEFINLAIEPEGDVHEGTSLPTEFVDVTADAYYYQPVLWAIENNITNGTSDITFSPDDECNMAQILTFLWRAAGSPQVQKRHIFADVYEDDYFYLPAQWANSLGMAERALYPNFSCSRLGAVYYIWCAAGRPECKTPLKFTDTTDTRLEEHYEAVAWAVEQGITSGTSETTFSPGQSCTRAQILTFLWRATQKGWI